MAVVLRAALFFLLCSVPAAAQELVPLPERGSDGLWVEDWFRVSAGDLRADLAAASAEGRILAIFWERPGCQYCELLHLEALREPSLRDFVARHFYAVRFRRYGRDPVVGFDGVVRTEEQLAVRHAVIGTPTIEFRIADNSEVYRIPGYASAPVLLAVFEYVQLGAYLHTSIVDWLVARGLM